MGWLQACCVAAMQQPRSQTSRCSALVTSMMEAHADHTPLWSKHPAAVCCLQGYQALAQPGEMVASISSTLLGPCSAAGSAPLLPCPTPPSGKAKAIEEAPSAAAAAAAAGEVPCAWLPSSTRLTCTAKVGPHCFPVSSRLAGYI